LCHISLYNHYSGKTVWAKFRNGAIRCTDNWRRQQIRIHIERGDETWRTVADLKTASRMKTNLTLTGKNRT
jgi:hypothetical protein